MNPRLGSIRIPDARNTGVLLIGVGEITPPNNMTSGEPIYEPNANAKRKRETKHNSRKRNKVLKLLKPHLLNPLNKPSPLIATTSFVRQAVSDRVFKGILLL